MPNEPQQFDSTDDEKQLGGKPDPQSNPMKVDVEKKRKRRISRRNIRFAAAVFTRL